MAGAEVTILRILGGIPGAICAALAIVAALVAGWQTWMLSRAEAEAEHWRASSVTYAAANHATVEAFDRYRADQEAARAALMRESARAATRVAEMTRLTSEAENAPDDRPVGPVLERGFERLRRLDAAPGGNQDREAGPAAATADLP